MTTFLLWCFLFVVCWPAAILALVLYPIIWLLSLPFRLLGFAVGSVFDLLATLLTLPFRVMNRLLGGRNKPRHSCGY